MPLTTEGRNFICQLLVGENVYPLNYFNAHIGVGDSTEGFSASQTDLQATVNKLRKGMSTGFPERDGNLMRFRSLFGYTEANFVWNEFGLFNAQSGGTMLTRTQVFMGTKPSYQMWEITVEAQMEIY